MAYCRAHRLFTPGDGVVLGVSGGADSVCLLFALHRLCGELGIRLYVGFECGLVFEGFNDIAEFDQIEAYKMVEVPR